MLLKFTLSERPRGAETIWKKRGAGLCHCTKEDSMGWGQSERRLESPHTWGWGGVGGKRDGFRAGPSPLPL